MLTPAPTSELVAMREEQCRSLLADTSVGRVAVVVASQPHVVPVNYVFDGEYVVFRTAAGTILNEADLEPVAFEIDHIDSDSRSGWSVVVHGIARDITDAIDPNSAHLRRLPVDPWAAGPRERWFEVIPSEITGRRVAC